MNRVLAEAFEMVGAEAITPSNFRDFVFTNAVRLYATTNPDFFKGTRVETEVSKALAKPSGSSRKLT
ncbi:MAG: hypothetical protein HYX90_10325 [Chloroflexi bacterium]|nr:hypothetical protein [Chloroflexota bacterium]